MAILEKQIARVAYRDARGGISMGHIKELEDRGYASQNCGQQTAEASSGDKAGRIYTNNQSIHIMESILFKVMF